MEKLKGIFVGFGSIFNPFGGADCVYRCGHAKTDVDALWSDWSKIGDDFRVSLEHLWNRQ